MLTPLPTQQQQTAADGPAEHSLHRATPKLSVRGGAAPNLAAAAGRHSAAQRRPADLGRLTLTLDLIGGPCAGSVEVVTDGLAGKSRWLRKAPLELAHAARPLLAGRRAVLLFAGGSAAKEQWHCALARGAAGAGPDPDAGPEGNAAGRTGAVGAAAASVEALYDAFCVHARDVAAVPYPQVGCAALTLPAPAVPSLAAPQHVCSYAAGGLFRADRWMRMGCLQTPPRLLDAALACLRQIHGD